MSLLSLSMLLSLAAPVGTPDMQSAYAGLDSFKDRQIAIRPIAWDEHPKSIEFEEISMTLAPSFSDHKSFGLITMFRF